MDHIKNGDRVFLKYPGDGWCHKFCRSAEAKEKGKGQLILVLVNPKTRIWEDHHYKEFEELSHSNLQFTFLDDIVPDLELRFGF